MLSEKMNEIIEGCSFRVVEEDDDVYISQYTPYGEDWNEVIVYDGTDEDFIKGLKERLEGFDVDEEVEVWVDLRGKNGVPSKISELLKDAEWKKEQLENLVNKIQLLL